jgi:D-amino-acid oxidase
MAEIDITVVGAGVIGLTTALLLSRKSGYNVTIIAKFMPGDHHIEYTSPWAGADFLPTGAEGSEQARFERETWPILRDLAENHPEAGIHFLTTYLSRRSKDVSAKDSLVAEDQNKPPWWHDVVPDFRILPPSETPNDTAVIFAFTSICINVELYLRYLLASCATNGAVIKRSIVTHISEAAYLHHSGRRASVVVNCTGLSSRFLGGVADESLVPARPNGPRPE